VGVSNFSVNRIFSMDIKDWASLIGAITGPAGLVVAVLVFFRDRARVEVSLQWDMQNMQGETVAIIRVGSTGRRPIFLSHAHIKLPLGAAQDIDTILFPESVSGVTLTEGSKPHLMVLNQNALEMEKYSQFWWKLRVTFVDSAGKKYHSDWPVARPSWAKTIDASKLAIRWNRFQNSLRGLRNRFM
jgi:hypothetical protein